MRVAIAGAGAVGRSVALELIENGHSVLLIDKESRSIRPDLVPEAQWLLADACELSALTEAQLETCDVVITATGDDKANLVTAKLTHGDLIRDDHPSTRDSQDHGLFFSADAFESLRQPPSRIAPVAKAGHAGTPQPVLGVGVFLRRRGARSLAASRSSRREWLMPSVRTSMSSSASKSPSSPKLMLPL